MNPFIRLLQRYSHLGPAELDQLQQVLIQKKYPAGHTRPSCWRDNAPLT